MDNPIHKYWIIPYILSFVSDHPICNGLSYGIIRDFPGFIKKKPTFRFHFHIEQGEITMEKSGEDFGEKITMDLGWIDSEWILKK